MDNLKKGAEREAQIILNYFKAEDYISAEIKAKKLIKKFPNYQAVYNLLGLSLQSQKKYTEAIKRPMKPYSYSAVCTMIGAFYWHLLNLMTNMCETHSNIVSKIWLHADKLPVTSTYLKEAKNAFAEYQ